MGKPLQKHANKISASMHPLALVAAVLIWHGKDLGFESVAEYVTPEVVGDFLIFIAAVAAYFERKVIAPALKAGLITEQTAEKLGVAADVIGENAQEAGEDLLQGNSEDTAEEGEQPSEQED